MELARLELATSWVRSRRPCTWLVGTESLVLVCSLLRRATPTYLAAAP
jgi:hypothetical protein